MRGHVIQVHKRGGILQHKVILLNTSVWAGHLYPVYRMLVRSRLYTTPINFTLWEVTGPFYPLISMLDVIIREAGFWQQNVKLFLCI